MEYHLNLEVNLSAKPAWIFIFSCAVLLVLCFAQSALAHRPLFAGPKATDPASALRIADPSVSHVIYAELTHDAPHRWFVFDNDKPRQIKLQIGVPAGKVQVPAKPTVAIFGPGLDAGFNDGLDRFGSDPASTQPARTLPMEPPQGENVGVVLLSPTDTPQTFDEPVTGTRSLILVETAVTLPETGTYYGVVFDDSGDEGKVWIGVGQSEGFGWRDVFRLPGWIRDVRRFHQVPGWPPWVWIFVGGLAVAITLVSAWVIQKVRRA